ncbi:peroxiredoxin family protein [Oceanobacillus kapialis]|uniref:Peroxiredoxin family protein n=1 Tax=Oceanobacillus kapialis TaxID=481353 RepID=A0ABW5Q0F0_9BACI
MKKVILITVLIGMLGWTVYEFFFTSSEVATQKEQSNSSEQDSEVGIDKGMLAPDFELTTLAGKQVKLSDYRGQRVMLNFWATWCPPCRAEMPDMQKFQENKDVKILAVNLTKTESDPDKVQEFIDKLNLSMTVPLDKESLVSDQYQIIAYPTTYMIDSDGRIQSVMKGAMNYDLMVQQFEMME